jgi:predicted ATPase/signal transduction histidine kinase
MVTGQLPFTGANSLEVIHGHVAKIATSPHLINEQVPVIVSGIIMTLMAKVPEERYQTASGLLADLALCQQSHEKFGDIPEFELTGADYYQRFYIPHKIYGRAHELDRLQHHLTHLTTEPGQAQLVLIAGYSGIGKSSLVSEFLHHFHGWDGYYLEAKFDQFQRHIPYSPILAALRSLIRSLLSTSNDRRQQIRDRLSSQPQERWLRLKETIPEISLLLAPTPTDLPQPIREDHHQFLLALQQLITAFTRVGEPLILFLDDLQWADSASFTLIQLLSQSPYPLMILGAYRNNEVNDYHPLMAMVRNLEEEQIQIEQLVLTQLDRQTVHQIVADSLHCPIQQAQHLGDFCFNHSQGNPFFLNKLLQSLSDQGGIYLNPEFNCWEYDLTKIQSLDTPTEVLDLMVHQLRQLEPSPQEILKIAAIIGHRFDLKGLAMIAHRDQKLVAQQLEPALNQSFVIPLDGNYRIPLLLDRADIPDNLEIRYRFAHDRIQQAAYQLLPPQEQQQLHLTMGRLQLASLTDLEDNLNLFEIVNHLNQGWQEIELEAEKMILIRLNIVVACKAKLAGAFESALLYCEQGFFLLPDDSWDNYYELSRELFQTAIEVAYLNLKFEQMARWATTALSHCQSFLEKCAIYNVQIQAYISQNQLTEAIDLALATLHQLNVGIIAQPTQEQITAAIAQTTTTLKQQQDHHVLSASPMTDQRVLAAIDILSTVASAAYISRPDLYPLIILKQVDLSVTYGYTPSTPYVYATYGLILCASETDIEFGNEMGQLALNLLEQLQALAFKAKVFNLVFPFVTVWKYPLRNSLKPLQAGYHSGIDTGDLEFAAYCAYNYCSLSYFAGERLPEISKRMEIYGEAISKIKQDTALNFHRIYWQTVDLLQQDDFNPELWQGDYYDETIMLPNHRRANDQYSIVCFYTNKLILNYLGGNYDYARSLSELAQSYLIASSGYPLITLYYFYDSLISLALYPTAIASKQPQLLARVHGNQQKLANWASHGQTNYQHKYDLVAAELAKVTGQYWEAANLYEQAIVGANENLFLQEEALAYERAALFYLEQRKLKIAKTYFKEAHYLYGCWGATGKVNHLAQQYNQFFNQPSTDSNSSNSLASTSHGSSEQLDLISIVKASQTLSGEIRRDMLLEQMMVIIMENAGADRGGLILLQEDHWRLEIIADLQAQQIQVDSQPLQAAYGKTIPASVIEYVLQVQQELILNDACHAGDFTPDPYIVNHQPRSLFGLPIKHQGTMVGLLYLENRANKDVFTNQRIEVIELLSSQAAISLENAQLYQKMEQQVIKRTAQLTQTLEDLRTTQSQLIESEKMAALGNLVAGVAHEISTPLGTSITASSFLHDLTQKFAQACSSGQLKKSFLQNYTDAAIESSHIILHNLQRAGALVSSFKQVAVDQTRLESRTFELKPYLEEVLISLQPEFKHRGHQFQITGDKELLITSYPGAFSQILTNLVINSIHHGYGPNESGLLSVHLTTKDDYILMIYSDDGRGIPPDHLHNIFEPFFTTARNQGGTGLGLHIVYNLVNHMLKGSIICESKEGQGTIFTLKFPLKTLISSE